MGFYNSTFVRDTVCRTFSHGADTFIQSHSRERLRTNWSNYTSSKCCTNTFIPLKNAHTHTNTRVHTHTRCTCDGGGETQTASDFAFYCFSNFLIKMSELDKEPGHGNAAGNSVSSPGSSVLWKSTASPQSYTQRRRQIDKRWWS